MLLGTAQIRVAHHVRLTSHTVYPPLNHVGYCVSAAPSNERSVSHEPAKRGRPGPACAADLAPATRLFISDAFEASRTVQLDDARPHGRMGTNASAH